MLNAIEPGSPLPIHRHQKSSETVVCLRGRLVWEYYDEPKHICTERIELSPNGPIVALNVPKGQWHSLQSLESGTVLFECKDGKWEAQREEASYQFSFDSSVLRLSLKQFWLYYSSVCVSDLGVCLSV